MKKVLFIAYYFPPIGGGGVQRSLKFVKYLPQFGLAPHVLTAAAPPAERWAPRDEQLLADLPPEAHVHRVTGLPEVQGERGWRRRLRDLCVLPTEFGAAWAESVLREGSRLCREHRPDVIFVTLSPFEGAAAAAELSRRFNIPWVADLRDPWALDEMQVFASGLHRRLARERMRHALREASLVIMNTPEAARRLSSSFPEYARRPVISLTNGFDADDYRGLQHERDDERFRIVHTGSLHTHHGRHLARHRRLLERLGRIEPGVDFLSRSHVFLLEALRRWQARDASVARHVRLILAGSLTPADLGEVQDSPARGLVTTDGYRTHAETVRLQVDADLLFLPMHDLPRGRRATIVPGKTYEYLAAQRPILAAVPEGDARDFVAGAGTGHVCPPGDIEGMIAILRHQYQNWQQRRTAPGANAVYIRQFERRQLTARLAEALQEVIDHPLPQPARSTRAERRGARPLSV